MALATYQNLQDAISTDAGWLARADLTTVDTDFITLAEARIANGSGAPYPSAPLRIRAMEKSIDLPVEGLEEGGTTTGTANAQTLALTGYTLTRGATASFTAGFTNTAALTLNINSTGVKDVRLPPGAQALVSGEVESGLSYTVYYDGTQHILIPMPGAPLPNNFLGVRRLFLSGDQDPINYSSPVEFWQRHRDNDTGKPKFYTIEDDTIILGPRQDGGYTLKLLFWQKFPALSATQTTNWLLTNAPNVYLYGALLEAAIYIDDDRKTQKYGALYASACAGLDAADQLARFPAGSLQCRPVGPTP